MSRVCLEYGKEVWEGNKSQAAAPESISLGGGKCMLGCSSKTCNEAHYRDETKLKWWYKLTTMPAELLFGQKWNMKPCRGRQRKVSSRVVDYHFASM